MAFKMNREGFTFYTKPEGPTMKHTNQFGKPHPEKEEDDYINIRKNEPTTKQGNGPTKMDKGYTRMENKGYPKEKPDYIDIDGDGNKTESMKDAAASKKGFSKTPYEKNKLPRLEGKLTKVEKKVPTGYKPQTQMTEEELAELKNIKNPQTIKSKKGFSKTPYEKNKYSSHMPKHGADHKMSSADEKRYDNLLNTLNKMNDPMNSNRGKSILKELKKLKPGFNPEDHTMGQTSA